ncbi:hypothetical protein LTR60_004338, partial [Cryomyces antarcticus]
MPKSLLLFLNARGRNLPDAFYLTDYDAARFGQITTALNPAFLNEYTMMFRGRTTAQTYGALVAWKDDNDAFNCLTSGIEMHPGHGLQILEIQQRVWDFLVQCCRQILHDVAEHALVSHDVQVQPEPPSISGGETGFNSLATVAMEAPYRVPAHLDLTRLQTIVAAKRSAAADH